MSVRNAVATVDKSPTALVPQYTQEFAAVLPEHLKSGAFVQLAVAALRRDSKLMEAAESNPGSLIYALRDCARLGHEPGTEQYYLTPRREKGALRILGVEGYQGVIERIYRAGAVSTVIVEAVRQHDRFTYAPGRDERPILERDWTLDNAARGPLVLVYGYAVMKDGATSKVVIVGKDRIERAKAASGTANSSYSPWTTDEEAMWLKTAAHDLSKWVPTSAEYRREILRAHADVAAQANVTALPPPAGEQQPPPNVDTDTGVIDGAIVEDPPGWEPVAEVKP